MSAKNATMARLQSVAQRVLADGSAAAPQPDATPDVQVLGAAQDTASLDQTELPAGFADAWATQEATFEAEVAAHAAGGIRTEDDGFAPPPQAAAQTQQVEATRRRDLDAATVEELLEEANEYLDLAAKLMQQASGKAFAAGDDSLAYTLRERARNLEAMQAFPTGGEE